MRFVIFVTPHVSDCKLLDFGGKKSSTVLQNTMCRKIIILGSKENVSSSCANLVIRELLIPTVNI